MAPKTAVNGVASANMSRKRKTAATDDEAPSVKKSRTASTASAGTKAKAAPASKKGSVTAKRSASAASTNGVTKRKAAKKENQGNEEVISKKPKIAKKVAEPKIKPRKKGPVINSRPSKVLNVFVFGENSAGELGLGAEGKVVDVKRPRLNPLLKDKKVVAVAAGGMHQVFLTDDGKILTCGVNDQGTLGRDTAAAEKLKDMDDDDSDADSDNGLNPLEAAPLEVDLSDVPEGTVFTSVAAGDSMTVAVTDDGLVYGCGTFRSNDGVLGFSKDVKVQRTLTEIAGLKHIKSIACGANHILALDKNGNTWAFGSGQQNQLGRRIVERTRFNGLVPSEFGLAKGKVTGVYCGAYHSFASDRDGNVWAWGLNTYGETGIPDDAGQDDAVIHKPTIVTQLSKRGVKHLAGGAHHSLAVTQDGECLVFGRVDGYQMGLKVADLPDKDIVRDEHNKTRILKTATAIPNIGRVIYGACGSDQSFAINEQGRAYAWGFSVNHQLGLGTTDDVEEATLIDNTATREEKLTWVGAGGQYGVLTSVQ